MGTPVQESNGVFLLMSYAHDKLGTVLHGRIFTIFLLIIVVIYCYCDREGGWSMEWRIGGGGSSDNDIFDRCILISKGFDINRQVKINDNNERRFGVVMTPFSSSKMKRINCQKKFA